MGDDSFKTFVLDQLRDLPELRARAMFGAHGLYSGDHFFGIIDDGRVFFKTVDANRQDYLERDMPPFTYVMQGETKSMAYHEVPADVLEQPHELLNWARKAIQVAVKAPKKVRQKAAPKSAPPRSRSPRSSR